MGIDTKYDLRETTIDSSNQVAALLTNDGKSVLAPIHKRRHIYTENIQQYTWRLLLETNTLQSYYCNLFIFAGSPDYGIEVLQRDSSISSNNSNVGSGLKTIWNGFFTYPHYKDLYLPPNCSLYLKANQVIWSATLVAELYFGSVIEKVT